MGQRKTRSILTILGVAVCIMLYLFMAGTVGMVTGNLEKEMAKYAGQIYVKSHAVSVQNGGVEFPPTSSVIDNQVAEQILNETAGIDRARSIPVLFKPLTGAVYPGGPSTLAVGFPAGKEEVYMGKSTAAGGTNHLVSDTAAEVSWVTTAAESFKAEVGKTIPIAGEDVRYKVFWRNRILWRLIIPSCCLSNMLKVFSCSPTRFQQYCSASAQ